MIPVHKHSYLIALFIGFLFTSMGCDSDSDTPEEDTDSPIPPDVTILAIGDSVMAWNGWFAASIPHVVEEILETPVSNRAIPGAFFMGGDGLMHIPNQYVEGEWEWVLMNGGANDLNDECGCMDCDWLMDGILSADGSSGELVDFVDDVTATGVSVMLMGYYQVPPTADFGFANCNGLIDDYTARLQLLAQSNDRVELLDTTPLLDPENLAHYADDHAHPSIEGSRIIGEAMATQIASSRQ